MLIESRSPGPILYSLSSDLLDELEDEAGVALRPLDGAAAVLGSCAKRYVTEATSDMANTPMFLIAPRAKCLDRLLSNLNIIIDFAFVTS
jgi:hypothetical protein